MNNLDEGQALELERNIVVQIAGIPAAALAAAAGLAAANLARRGQDVLVTSPQYRSAGELFTRAAALLSDATSWSVF